MSRFDRRLLAAGAALVLLPVLAAGFREWKQGAPFGGPDLSPNGRYRIQKFETWTPLRLLPVMPGGGSDHAAGYVRLFDAEGNLLAETFRTDLEWSSPRWVAQDAGMPHEVWLVDGPRWTLPSSPGWEWFLQAHDGGIELPDGLRLTARNGELVVAMGDDEVVISKRRGASAVLHVVENERHLRLSYEDNCGVEAETTLLRPEVLARLEESRGLRSLEKGDVVLAAKAFRAALHADPQLASAVFHLASLLARTGQVAEARAVYAGRIETNPYEAYLEVLQTPELELFSTDPAFAALRSARPGPAALDPKALVTGFGGNVVAVQPERRLLAVTRTELSWGSDCRFDTDLVLFDGKDGRILGTLRLVNLEEGVETDGASSTSGGHCRFERPSEIEARVRLANRVLADLGFRPAEAWTLEPSREEVRDVPAETLVLRIPGTGLELRPRATVSVWRGGQQLGEARLEGELRLAAYVPSAKAVVVEGWHEGAEGCEATDPVHIAVVPLQE